METCGQKEKKQKPKKKTEEGEESSSTRKKLNATKAQATLTEGGN